MKTLNTANTTIVDVTHRDPSTVDFEIELPNGESHVFRTTRFHNAEGHGEMVRLAEELWESGDEVQFCYSLDDRGGKIIRDLSKK